MYQDKNCFSEPINRAQLKTQWENAIPANEYLLGVTYARCIAEGERNKTVLANKDLKI